MCASQKDNFVAQLSETFTFCKNSPQLQAVFYQKLSRPDLT